MMTKRTSDARITGTACSRWQRAALVAIAALVASPLLLAAPGNGQGQPPAHSKGGASGNSAQPAGQGEPASGTNNCQPKTTPRDDDIVCEEEQDSAIDAGRGDDQVSISADALIDVSDTGSAASAIAVDADLGDDIVNNSGTVKASAISAGGGFKSVPGQGLLGVADALLAGASATGIEGGDGADRIDNSGTVQADAVAVAGELDTGSSAGNPIVHSGHDAASAAHASATGISGGDGEDLVSNSGTIGATATAVSAALTLNLSANGAAADSSGKAESEAVGIDGDAGTDQLSNLGVINAVATSTALGQNVSVAPDGHSSVSSNLWSGSPESDASATGVRAGSGNDDVANRGDINAVATALSGSAAVTAGVEDVALTGAQSKSLASATAIASGGGDDSVTNEGALTAVATAGAVGIELAVTAGTDGQMASENGTSAEARSVGISSDGGDPEETSDTGLFLNPNRLIVTTTESQRPASGNDTINMSGAVTAVATAVSGEGSGAIALGGTSSSELNASAKSAASAVHAGGGNDRISNDGELIAVSSAVAAGIQATVSVNPGEDDLDDEKLKSLFEDNEAKAGGAVIATAEATGIGSDGGGESTTNRFSLDLSADGLFTTKSTHLESAGGDDAIDNSGGITAVATALAGSVSASIGINDAANVDTATTARSAATGVAMGGGDDHLVNSGAITAVSTATAVGREAAASVKGDAKVAADSGTVAEARATGISADGSASDTRHEGSLAITPTSLETHLRDEINGATGSDSLVNSGSVTAVATAVSGEQSAPVSIGGSASGNAKSTATALASALEAGDGDDGIDNSGDLTAVATATAAAVELAVAVKGGDGDSEEPAPDGGSAKSSASAAVTAEATATGLSADDGVLDSATQFDLAIDGDGLRTAYLRETNAAGGGDNIANSGNITAVATSLSGSLAVPIGIEGDATSDTTSKASSSAMGVDAGDGSDIVNTSGNVTAVATAAAQGLAVSVSTKGDAEVSSDSGSTAEAYSTGLSADGASRSSLTEAELEITAAGLHIGERQEHLAASGDDVITNSGAITAVAAAVAGEASGAVSLDGSAKADVKATAASRATGIDAGAGDDAVTIDGPVTAVASSLAVPVSAEVATKGNATSAISLADTSGAATATAVGISGDGSASSRTMDANLDIGFATPALQSGFERAETAASGADTITNRSAITALATAAMPTVDVAVSTKGYAAALSTAEAEATATAIDAGAGDDAVFNEGALNAIATAGAAAINVSVATKSSALSADTIWNGGTRATATAVGIDGDGGSGDSRDALGISLSPEGAHVSYISEMAAATGNDSIDNMGLVSAVATAASGSGNVAVSSKSGIAAAVSQSSATAAATGINAGAGDDSVVNEGIVNATALSVATAAAVSVVKSGVSIAGNAIWDGGVAAAATAVGIHADGGQISQHDETRFDFTGRLVDDDAGDASRQEFVVRLANAAGTTAATGEDSVVNEGTIIATAVAEAPAVSVGVASGSGMAAAISTARADAAATGIDGGGGSDTIGNSGEIVSSAIADATAVNASVTKSGVSISADAVADGGTTARAFATGIGGDGDGQSDSRSSSIEARHAVNTGGDGGQTFEDSIRLESQRQFIAARGDDVIHNSGVIAANAIAVTRPLGVALTQSGVSVASSTSTAQAGAAGIDAGAGNDIVHNDALVESAAVAIAAGTSVAVTQSGGSLAGNLIWDGSVRAQADAVGIDGDGAGQDRDAVDLIDVNSERVVLQRSIDLSAAGGDDLIVNDGAVIASAFAEAPAIAAAVTITGASAASATAMADARSVAIDAGDGADAVLNSGALVSTAVANANALNASFAQTGAALAADAVFDGGTTAVAEAIGIAGDGDGAMSSHLDRLVADGNNVLLTSGTTATGASGADLLVNDGTIVSTAAAIAPSIGVAVTTAGAAAAITSATADARSAAMDGGGGNDDITNGGELVSTAVANADTVSVAVAVSGAAVSGNSFWDGGVTATSEAMGIDADGRGRDIAAGTSLAVDEDGVRAAFTRSDRAASGDDRVTNDGDIVATSVSLTPAINVAVAPTGVAAAVATATAESRAVGIGGGAGNDMLENNGSLVSTATSAALAANVSFSAAGVAVSSDALFSGGTTSVAEAVGIDGDGADFDFVSHATAEITDESVSIGGWHSRSSAAGGDWILNNDDVTATAVATAGSLGVAVTPAGLAGAITTATAESRAAAIDAGGGDDEIDNAGNLSATSVANADTVSVAVAPAGVAVAANALWNGGVTAEAEAVGIDADGNAGERLFETRLQQNGATGSFEFEWQETVAGGDDVVRNEGEIAASAVAVTPSVGVAVTPAGVSVAASTATAISRAAGIDTGPGDDEVLNSESGTISAEATSVAAAVNVAVAPAGGAIAGNDVWDGGVMANARATGIETDGASSRTRSLSMTNAGLDDFSSIEDFISYSDETVEASGNDRVVNAATIDATATAVAPAASVAVAVWGLSASISTATSESEALGIDTGGGEDEIDNSGDINASATSVATAVNVAVTVGGVAGASDALWDGGTTAIAHTAAIDAGDGDDIVGNSAWLTSRAVAVAPSVSVPVGIFGVAAATSTATAEADADGIVGGRGDDVIDNSGHVDVSSTANATAVSIPVNIFGVAASTNDVWDGGVESHARATGISAGEGDDNILNSGLIDASGNAVTPSVSVPFSVGGVASALSTSTATSDVGGIRAGAGIDTIDNIADILASADATAVTVGAAISVFGVAAAGDSFWDGGTTASATAVGISGEENADVIDNAAAVEARALARSNSDQVAATLIGVSAAVATSNSTARAAALDGGDGGDSVFNRGDILADAEARATSVAVSFSGIGAAVATDAFWDGGTSALSTAYGIAGGEGEDFLHNFGRLESRSTADSDSVNVATAAGIMAAVVASSEAVAEGFGISGGSGADEIVNAADLIVDADADAGAVGVSATLVGASLSGSFVDNETVAEASATGLDGGKGDDLVVTSADSSLDVGATGTTTDKDVAVTATAGFADADANAVARANASGAEGGSGDDTLSLAGEIAVAATADGLSRSFGWATLAVSRASADSSANAVARGAGGGEGNDVILQQADMSADAAATVVGRTGSVVGTGFTTASIESVGTAGATGLAGDAGDDLLINSHAISASSTADVTAKSFSLSAIGATTVHGASTATATAIGIDGGEGNDELVNEGSTSSHAMSIARAESTTLNLVGAAISEADLSSSASAEGMQGGTGDDLIVNLGSLSTQGSAEAVVSGIDWTLGGFSGLDGFATATVAVSGIDGGDGMDTIVNAGNITVDAGTDLRSSGTSSAIFGATSSAGTIDSTLFVTGITGGGDDDRLFNDGAVNVNGMSTLNSNTASWIIGGVSGAEVGMSGNATGFGMAGGSGDDLLVNNGDVGIALDFEGLMNASSWTLIGGASATGTYATAQQAFGLAGGDGNDRLENLGSVSASTFSDLEVSGGFTALLGHANGESALSSTASATGFSGGTGMNELLNFGTVDVGAQAAMKAESVAFTFAGGASATASLQSEAIAMGMWGGHEADHFFNEGVMTIGAIAAMASTGGTRTSFGDSTAEASVTAIASSTGMGSDGGDDLVYNDGSMSVTAIAAPTASSHTDAGGLLLIDGIARARTATEAVASGASLGNGANVLLNDGLIETRSAGVGVASADAQAGSVTASSATSAARADTALAQAHGVLAGNGSNAISNRGSIGVFISNGLDSSADADGHGLLVGHGGASSSSRIHSASAVGIEVGHGSNTIGNDGELVVEASPNARGVSRGQATGFDTINPANAVGNASGTVDGALAIGIRAGNGDNSISNAGAMSVTAAPVANSTTLGRHRQLAALAVDSFATSTSSASNASAYGIFAGDGENLIRNAGTLDVTAAPRAIASATAIGHGWDGDATARATASAENALAVGIFAGNGNNVVVNEGTIAVTSAPVAATSVSAEGGLGEVESAVGTVTEEICGWNIGPFGIVLGWVCETVVKPVTETLINEGEEVAVANRHTNGAQAYGIWTGAGDDLVINTGSISAATIVNGTSGFGVGVRTGAGNDEVRFGNGSSVSGHVWLEGGDDTLALWGSSSVSGVTNAGAGFDRLDMFGAGSFAGALVNFEAAAKHQAGTFALNTALPTLDTISVFEGTFAVAGSYSMDADSNFMTRVNADGSHGRFEVAEHLSLDGTLSITRDDGLFVDGTRYGVITAGDIDGAFDTFDLPEPTSMLSFAVEQGDSQVDVVVSVEPLAAFAATDNPLARSMGAYMDGLTSSASGELAGLLRILQLSDDSGLVADTLATMTPSDRESTVTGSLAALRRSQDAVHERLAAIRSGSAGKSYFGGDSAVNLFAGDGFEPGRPGGLWVATMSFDGGQAAGKQPAFASENYLFGGGIDLSLGERFVIGGSVFAGFSDLRHERMNDASEMKSVLGSVYASFAYPEGHYIQGVVSAGPADYRSFRHLHAPFVSRLVESNHSGDALAAGFEAGRSLRLGPLDAEWFAGLDYIALTEHAFEESGGGSLGFAAQGAQAESLVSELGIRSAIDFERPWGVVRPRLSLSWLHEHDIGADTLTAHLLGAPDSSFTFRHDRAGDGGYRLSLGVEVQSDENGFFTLKWNEDQLGSYADSSVLAKFGMRF